MRSDELELDKIPQSANLNTLGALDASSLDGFVFEPIRQDGVLSLYRGRHQHAEASVLVAQAATAADGVEAALKLANEYALRDILNPTWALVPRASMLWHGGPALIYDDIGVVPLDEMRAQLIEVDVFLECAAAIAGAVRHMHAAGIQHNNVKPSNLLVGSEGNWLITGFGGASRISGADPRDQPKILSTTFAYMSPEHTGRTRRRTDTRSDLYSLGVIFYELLTGRLPFNLGADADSADWIHQHLASEPTAPHLVLPGIPGQLSALVLKLLAKNPDARYQTAAGLESDLKRCRLLWAKAHRIEEFPLGSHETNGELMFGDKLYARDTSLQSLLRAFDHVAAARTRALAVVHGQSGVGKSALLSSFFAQLRLRHACVATGKVDQYSKDLPYAVIAQALHSLVMHIVAQSDETVAFWRQRLLHALGEHGDLALNLVPALEHLVGDVAPVPDLPAPQAQIRFRAVMQRLLGAFASPGEPLVLIIDDLQWIDPPSMQLLEYVMSCAEDIPLLLIAAYRDEGGTADPLFESMLDSLHSQSSSVVEITLEGLSAKAIERMIADLLGQSPREVRDLGRLIYEKTNGNPFFVRQFVKAIVDDGLIVFDAAKAEWRFDLPAIRETTYTDNVAILVLQRLSRMPPDTRYLLGGLACLGRHTAVETLARLHSRSVAEVGELLEPALKAEAVFFSRDGLGFCHDRVQEAAYMMINEDQRYKLHLAIGRQLLDVAIASDHDEDLFRAYDHLAIAAPLIVDKAERLAVANLGLSAAKKAKRAIAYDSAMTYIHTALSLVNGNCSGDGSGLVFPLMLELAECKLICGKLSDAGRVVDDLLARPAPAADRAMAFCLKTELHLRRSNSGKAVDTALEGLQGLGIFIDRHPTEADCALAYQSVAVKLTDQPEQVLLALKPLQDTEVEAALALLSVLSVPASFTDDRLQFLQLCHTLDLTLKHGMTGAGTVALSWFGVLVGHRFGKYHDGFRYGQLSRALVTKHHYLDYEAKTLLPLDQLSVWTQPLTFSIDCAKAGFTAGVAHGDTTMACFECCHLVANYLTRGDHLDSVWAEAERGFSFVRQAAFQDVEAILSIQMRFIDNLRRSDSSPFSGNNILLSDLDLLTGKDNERMPTLLFWFWLYKAISHYLASEFEQAWMCLNKAEHLAWSAPGHIHLLDFHLFYALTHAARAASTGDVEAARAKIRPHYDKIAEWASINPGSFADKEALVQAELARLDGDPWKALNLYSKAIRHAEEQGFVQYAAYAHELAARLYLNAGMQTAGEAHLNSAHNAYRCWGATAKAKQLELRYPMLLQKRVSPFHATVAIAESTEGRDMASVIRSVRALSEEIHLDSLIKVLMTTAIEHASAQRGFLIRLQEGTPFIAACAETSYSGVAVKLVHDVPGAGDLPLSILQTTMRTLQPVHYAGSMLPSPFMSDPYLQDKLDCAAMCIPLVKRGELVGVLYLENRMMSEAFTDSHAKVLEILAAQAAISLEIARLYSELMEENTQRRKAEGALKASEATLELGEQISHTGSWHWDLDQNVVSCSAEFCRIFGLDMQKRRLPFDEVIAHIHPDDRSMVLDSLHSSTVEQRAIHVEYRILRADSSIRYLFGVGKPSGGEDDAVSYVGTVTDITERRASEDALRISQAELARVTRITTVGQLTASIAHEINQPLMSIVSNGGASLRWLDRNPPELGEVRAGLSEIVSEAGRAGHIIRSLHALTLNCGPVMGPVDLHDTVRHILAIARSEIERRAVSIELCLAAHAYEVLGDSVQLQQVLLNLVVNAIDAMSEVVGRARVLSISSHNVEEGQILISVQDTGVGLSAEAKERIFDPFYTTKRHGMGMGLAISRSIVDAHRGRLEASAVEPCGSIFSLVLPLVEAGHEATRPEVR
ncbi:AAA family ATPase [Herbaspirillum sp. GCM10030257]|uniref:AAA family ATPase n=1 Tax=Herbaspirillum sp. GCM10030257 TaxID=3273393 RepID=UPI0036184BBE